MTRTSFDEGDWSRCLGAALEEVAANARPQYSPMPPMRLGIRPAGEYDVALRLGYRNLAERAKQDPTAWKRFRESNLWIKEDPAEARAILREHPLMEPWVEGSGKNEAVRICILNGGHRAGLTGLVGCLAKLSVKEGGEGAARRLHEFIAAAANARIPADEVIVIHGLILSGRVDLGSGAYLVPYEDARIEFDLPDEPEPFQKKRTPNAAALVRSLEFGPGIGLPEKGTGFQDVRINYCFPTDYRIDLVRWFEDDKFLIDLLSVASRTPLLSRTRYTRLPKWIQEIDPNFAYPNQTSGGFVSDAWPRGRDLSKSGADDFVTLARDWYAEEKPHALGVCAAGRLRHETGRQPTT